MRISFSTIKAISGEFMAMRIKLRRRMTSFTPDAPLLACCEWCGLLNWPAWMYQSCSCAMLPWISFATMAAAMVLLLFCGVFSFLGLATLPDFGLHGFVGGGFTSPYMVPGLSIATSTVRSVSTRRSFCLPGGERARGDCDCSHVPVSGAPGLPNRGMPLTEVSGFCCTRERPSGEN